MSVAAVRGMGELEDRPRERLWRGGAVAVGDDELLAILLGAGIRQRSAAAVAADLVSAAGGVVALSRASPRELALTKGVGAARALRVVAAFELGRRAIERVRQREAVSHADDVYRLVEPRLTGLAQEVFLAIGLDVRNQVLEIIEIARGRVDAVDVHPREVFRPLVRMAATAAVLVHNHPSGDPTPSSDDIELTHRLREVGRVVGIPIVDHVVVGESGCRSIGEWLGTAF